MTDLPSTPREALEAAAKACDHVATELGYQIEEADPEADAWDDGFVEGCSRCVAAIRAIPVAEPTPDPLTAKLVEALRILIHNHKRGNGYQSQCDAWDGAEAALAAAEGRG